MNMLLIGNTIWSTMYESGSAVTIIGGADGPTSVFVAGKVNTLDYGMIIVLVLVLICIVIGLITLLVARKRK